jgi:hypothetical protein
VVHRRLDGTSALLVVGFLSLSYLRTVNTCTLHHSKRKEKPRRRRSFPSLSLLMGTVPVVLNTYRVFFSLGVCVCVVQAVCFSNGREGGEEGKSQKLCQLTVYAAAGPTLHTGRVLNAANTPLLLPSLLLPPIVSFFDVNRRAVLRGSSTTASPATLKHREHQATEKTVVDLLLFLGRALSPYIAHRRSVGCD